MIVRTVEDRVTYGHAQSGTVSCSAYCRAMARRYLADDLVGAHEIAERPGVGNERGARLAAPAPGVSKATGPASRGLIGANEGGTVSPRCIAVGDEAASPCAGRIDARPCAAWHGWRSR